MRVSRALIPLALLSACTPAPPFDRAEGKRLYMIVKQDCIASTPKSLTAQSDCMAAAADKYIRPYYRYGDLMTEAQAQRRALAVRADAHQISRREYDRQVAKSDAAISREEDRRNATPEPPSPFAWLFH